MPFTLLADTNREIIRSYEAGGIIIRRVSYLIDPEGKTAKVYPKFNPSAHAREILGDLEDLESR